MFEQRRCHSMRRRADLLIWLCLWWCIATVGATVERFLERLGLQRYQELFDSHEITMMDLPSLTRDDFVEMGIIAVGPRRRIQREIVAMNAGGDAAEEEACTEGDARDAKASAPTHFHASTSPIDLHTSFFEPVGAERFFDEIWRKQPFHLIGNGTDRKQEFAHMFQLSDLAAFVDGPSPSRLLPDNVKLFPHKDVFIARTDSKGRRKDMDTDLASDYPITSHFLQSHLDAGNSFVLASAYRVWRPFYELNMAMEELLQFSTAASVYITPPSNRGFALHYDAHDLFFMQLQGAKHWKVYAPLIENAVTANNFDPDVIRPHLKLVKECWLYPGDTLYIPAGYLHENIGTIGVSIHYTLSGEAPTLAELMVYGGIIDEALLSSLSWRRTMMDELTAAVSGIPQHQQDGFVQMLDQAAQGLPAEVRRRVPAGIFSMPKPLLIENLLRTSTLLRGLKKALTPQRADQLLLDWRDALMDMKLLPPLPVITYQRCPEPLSSGAGGDDAEEAWWDETDEATGDSHEKPALVDCTSSNVAAELLANTSKLFYAASKIAVAVVTDFTHYLKEPSDGSGSCIVKYSNPKLAINKRTSPVYLTLKVPIEFSRVLHSMFDLSSRISSCISLRTMSELSGEDTDTAAQVAGQLAGANLLVIDQVGACKPVPVGVPQHMHHLAGVW
jgi:hypothetical protein